MTSFPIYLSSTPGRYHAGMTQTLQEYRFARLQIAMRDKAERDRRRRVQECLDAIRLGTELKPFDPV